MILDDDFVDFILSSQLSALSLFIEIRMDDNRFHYSWFRFAEQIHIWFESKAEGNIKLRLMDFFPFLKLVCIVVVLALFVLWT